MDQARRQLLAALSRRSKAYEAADERLAAVMYDAWHAGLTQDNIVAVLHMSKKTVVAMLDDEVRRRGGKRPIGRSGRRKRI